MTTLVTGAGGGLAATVIRRFAASGGGPIIASGRAERGGDDYVRCDLSDRADVLSMIRGVRPRLVVHLAGSFRNDFATDVAVNALSAGWMLDALLTAGLDTRIVLVGSAAEYGLVEPGDNPVPETRPLKPMSVYGLTKAMQTQVAEYYAGGRGANVVVARLFNVIGPGLSQRLFVGRAQAQIERYQRGEIDQLEFGNLESERDYLTTDEAADRLALIASLGVRGEVYNVGSGRPVRMRELLRSMLERAGCADAPIVEHIVKGRAAVVDLPCIYADVRKLDALATGAW